MRRVARILLLLGLLVLGYLWFLAPRGPEVLPGSVVVIDVQGQYVESAEAPLLARALGDAPTPLLRLYSQLRKAERDDRVHAVVLRIRPLQIGWAKAQEIRDALIRLRDAGRKTVAYIEVEPIGANLEYYIASAAERVYVSPATRIPFVGLAAEYLFLGGLWDKIGVDLEVERVGPHKTAADFLAGRSMSPEHRAMANWLLDSIEGQFVEGIAAGRGLEPDAVRGLMATAPSAPEELREAGLVDEVGFYSDVLRELGEDRPVLKHAEWAQVDPAALGFEPVARVALVYGSGNVVTGEGDRTPGGSPVLASTTVSEAIEAAAEDESVDAILFRIDSPGGSALASDLVWHATQQARARKPVVVSFSDVAASGGYYVACGADAIVAQPGTVTGSIGVVMIRPVIARLYEKLGIGVESLTRGDNADLFVTSQPMDDAGRKILAGEVERTYQLFLDRVVAGRDLERDAVDRVARGRVWTGGQAAERGLVDELGGLYTAVARIRQELKLPEDADLGLVVFPPPKPLALELRELLGTWSRGVAQPWPLPEPLRRALAWVETLPLGAPALLPSIALEIR